MNGKNDVHRLIDRVLVSTRSIRAPQQLWPAIEKRARARPPVWACAAAALVGLTLFVGIKTALRRPVTPPDEVHRMLVDLHVRPAHASWLPNPFQHAPEGRLLAALTRLQPTLNHNR